MEEQVLMNLRLNRLIFLSKTYNSVLMKIIFTSIATISLLLSSCGSPEESMNRTMADFTEKCIEDVYDCECYGNKVKAHFKTDEAYIKHYEVNNEIPDELVESLFDCMK